MVRVKGVVLLSVFYFLAAKLGLHLAVVHPYASAVWPPSGIALAGLFIFGRSAWPGIYIGAFFANLTIGGAIDGRTAAVAAAIAAGNTLEPLCGWWLIERFSGGIDTFDRASGVFRFSVLAAGMSTLISAAVGVLSLTVAGLAPARDAARIGLTWWIGDSVGDLLITPLLIVWSRETRNRWKRARTLELALAETAALLLAIVSFTNVITSHGPGLGLAFLCTPALLWPAFRLGLPETALTLLLVDGVAIWAWLRGFMMGDIPPTYLPLELQAYFGLTAVVFLAVAAEREHGASQQRELSLVTDDAPVYLAHCDREGRYCFVNRAYAARFKLLPEQLVGRNLAEVVGPKAYESLRGYIDAALAGTRVEFEVEIEYAGIGTRVEKGTYVPEYSRTGQPAGFVCASIDITGEKQTEAKLKAEYALRETIENSTLTGIAAIDADGRQTYVNPAFCRMVGYSAEELIGQSPPFAYWPAEETKRIQEILEQTRRGPSAPEGYTLRLQRRGGERFDALVLISTGRIGQGQLGWIASFTDVTEHQRLHESIQRQEALLRLVIDGMPGLVAYLDRDYRYRFVNRNYAEWFRTPAAEIEGRTMAELAGAERAEAVRPYVDRALAGEVLQVETTMRYEDRERTVRARYVPDRGPDNSVRGIVALVEDITAESAALKGLRESEEKFRQIVETASEGIWIVDPQGITTFVNSRACDMVGFEPHELIGRNCLNLVHPDDRPRGNAAFERRKEGDISAREYRMFRKNGEMIWIHYSGAPLRDESGNVTAILGMFTDITERKHNEARYQALFQTSQDGVLVVNDSGIYVDVNQSYCAMLKATREEMVGSFFAPHIPQDRLADAEAAFRQLMQTGRFEGEFPLLASDGSVIELEWRSVGNFVPGLHCCIARPIGERKRFEQQMQQTQKLESLGLMAGGIAHDFNNLLVGILGNASLALEFSRDTSTKPMLQDVVTAAERASGLVRQMLSYAGKGGDTPVPTDVGALMEETVTLLKASIRKTVAVQVRVEDGLPWVKSDPAQLQQIIMNMVINAAESIPEGRPGIVSVTASARPLNQEDAVRSIVPITLTSAEYVEMRFTDTGCGMTPEVQSKIFDPFFTTKFTGRGLGLSAVLGIVRAHGGTVTVDSAPDQGTTFRVLLPAVAPQVADVQEGGRGAATGRGGSILIIDDEETVRSVSVRALSRRGHSVFAAASGPEGVDILAAHPEIALVILDLDMPGMTGDQVLPLLRARKQDIAVIVSSGHAESEAVRRMGGAQFTAFLQKPYTAGTLAAKVTAALDGDTNAAATVPV